MSFWNRLPVTIWIAVVLGLVEGGWMVFDGGRALIVNEYIRIDGELGPWADIVTGVGLNPLEFRLPFVALGAAWFVALGGLLAYREWGFRVTVAVAAISLLYLGFGTAAAAAVVIFLFIGSRGYYERVRGKRP